MTESWQRFNSLIIGEKFVGRYKTNCNFAMACHITIFDQHHARWKNKMSDFNFSVCLPLGTLFVIDLLKNPGHHL